ncbi:hypothetical protein ACIPF8_18880 [Collimonas sp. NPDC087041]|uniref:hypothetical protein n=1 Tax=Collimonas sp. NPDC087041 TaxID=3363960 RepID=UPI0037FC779A
MGPEKDWRVVATMRCVTPLDTQTRHNLIMALMREESVIINDTLLYAYDAPPGHRYIFGQNPTETKYGHAAGKTFDLFGCAEAVVWAERQQKNRKK